MLRKNIIGLFFFVAVNSSFSNAHTNLDSISEAIENDREKTAVLLVEKFEAKGETSREQLHRFQQALINASPSMLGVVEKIGLDTLSPDAKSIFLELKQDVQELRRDLVSDYLINDARALINGLGHDPKTWLFLMLANAKALAQNCTCSPCIDSISQTDLDNILKWTHHSFALSWTLVTIIIIVPTAVGIFKCCCSGK